MYTQEEYAEFIRQMNSSAATAEKSREGSSTQEVSAHA